MTNKVQQLGFEIVLEFTGDISRVLVAEPFKSKKKAENDKLVAIYFTSVLFK